MNSNKIDQYITIPYTTESASNETSLRDDSYRRIKKFIKILVILAIIVLFFWFLNIGSLKNVADYLISNTVSRLNAVSKKTDYNMPVEETPSDTDAIDLMLETTSRDKEVAEKAQEKEEADRAKIINLFKFEQSSTELPVNENEYNKYSDVGNYDNLYPVNSTASNNSKLLELINNLDNINDDSELERRKSQIFEILQLLFKTEKYVTELKKKIEKCDIKKFQSECNKIIHSKQRIDEKEIYERLLKCFQHREINENSCISNLISGVLNNENRTSSRTVNHLPENGNEEVFVRNETNNYAAGVNNQ